MTFFASVHITKFNSRSQLGAAASHALRTDAASLRRLRPGAKLGDGLAFSTQIHDGANGRDFEAMRDVAAAFDAHLARNKVSISARGDLGFHAIVSVSRDWVAAAGQLHDSSNPRNRDLLKAAVAWMESWAGGGSVYAGRIDLDEEGGGNVDLFVMPTRVDGRSRKLTISTSKALTELRVRRHQRMAYVAMQDDWAAFAADHLDPAIVRGLRKAETTIEHLEVEEFKAASSEASRRLLAAAEQVEERAANLAALLAMVKDIELTANDRNALLFAEAELRALTLPKPRS